jgi:general secretion pathway protein A
VLSAAKWGVGKTTLLGELLRRLDHRFSVGLVSNTHASFGELLQWIAAAFGLPAGGADRLELQQRFVDFVVQRYAHYQRTLLIIDEAQNLSVTAMDELRMLSNLNCDKHLVLQVMLVGQSGLRGKLRRPELAQFAQRIAVEHHLGALTASETRQYIAHRLAHAGGEVSLFNSDACLLIQDASGGIPRLINRICDLSLVYAYAQQRLLVGAEIVAAVLRDQELGGLFESVRQPLPNSGDSGHGPTEHATPRADIASAGARPPLQRRLKATAGQVGGDAWRPISAGLCERPAAVNRARSAVAAPPGKDSSRASAAPHTLSELYRVVVG